jgi:hypothetical protein
MTSKTKVTRLDQKTYWETRLSQRLSVLADKGVVPGEMSKDATLRKIRAKIRETEARLTRIEALDKKAEEMARTKAEKEAIPKTAKDKKKKDDQEITEVSKRQLKKQKKREKKE